jgi:polyhydroxybutyrate depolymerase
MKYIIITLAFAINFSFLSQTVIDSSIAHDGNVRTYKLYIPASYDGSEEVPLLLNLHGLGRTSDFQLEYGDFRAIADTANFIILLPQGTIRTLGGQTVSHWNANLGTFVKDLEFLSALIDTISDQYAIDSERVFSTGMSNGGFMSLTLAGQLSDKITAVASVAGTMTLLQEGRNTVTKPVPIMQIHGDDDPTVSYTGAIFQQYKSVEDVINLWVAHNNCTVNPIITPLQDVNTTDDCTAIRYDYFNGDNGAEVVHYKIIGGGHTWPGGYPRPGKVTNYDFDASTEIWKFFSRYKKSALLSVDEFVEGESWISIKSENPTSGPLKLTAFNDKPYTISVLNMQGKQVRNQQNNKGESLINLEGLSNGHYLIKITNDSQVAVIKLIKK